MEETIGMPGCSSAAAPADGAGCGPIRERNIILVGFMGTGKSSVGAVLAKRLGWRFVDLDREIVNETGLEVADIFRTLGEAFFRNLEKKLLAKHCKGRKCVLAAGGGAVCDPDNIRIMKESGPVICLTAPAGTIEERLAGDGSRPLLKGSGDEKRSRMEALLNKRMPFYQEADIMLDTSDLTPEDAALIIEKFIQCDD